MRCSIPLATICVALVGCNVWSPPIPGEALAELDLPSCDGRAWPKEGEFEPLVEAGEWNQLEAILAEYDASYRANPACERRLVFAFEAGFVQGPDAATALDRWVEARPDSWLAVTARGVVWARGGFSRRGADSSQNTSRLQFSRMREAHDVAADDLARAVAHEPRNPAAWGSLLDLAKAGGTIEQRTAVYRDAIRSDPVSEHIRRRAVVAFDPAWGGSIEQIQGIVSEALDAVNLNPRLARLAGEPHLYRARSLHRSLEGESGPNARFSGPMAWLLIAYYDYALRWSEPASSWHEIRAWARYQSGQLEAAAEDAQIATDRAPTKVHQWTLQVRALREVGRLEDAERVARQGIAAVPQSPRVYGELAATLSARRRPGEAAEAYHAYYERSSSDSHREWALRNEGIQWVDAREYRRAVAPLSAALEMNPGQPDTLMALAAALDRLHEPGVRPLLVRFLEITKGDPGQSQRRSIALKWMKEHPEKRT